MADNTLTLKLDNETALPLLEKMGKDIIMPIVEGAGKSAYAIAVSHGYTGTESEWLESLRGPKGDPGDKGDPFKFSDFTLEQLNALKGKKGDKGDPGSAADAAKLLKSKNIYLENTDVNTVLTKLIEKLFESGTIQDATFRQLEYTQPRTGQDYIDLTGEPHFKVAVNGGEKKEFENDNMRVAIEPFGPKNIELKYYDLNDNEQQTLLIIGTNVTPDEVYTDVSGVVYKRFGDEIKIDVSNYNKTDIFKILPNWNVADIHKITINTDKRVLLQMNKSSLYDKSNVIANNSNSRLLVENPENTVFKWLDNYWTYLSIQDLTNDFGRDVSTGNSSEPYFIYDASSHEYINSNSEGL